MNAKDDGIEKRQITEELKSNDVDSTRYAMEVIWLFFWISIEYNSNFIVVWVSSID